MNIANGYPACHSVFMTKLSPDCIATIKGQRINSSKQIMWLVITKAIGKQEFRNIDSRTGEGNFF